MSISLHKSIAAENPPDRALNADLACGFNRESSTFRLTGIAAGDRSSDREPPTLFKFSLYLWEDKKTVGKAYKC
ncbi:hypothetical protein QUA82_17730 [Microcoleus sp. F8-D3]